MSGSGTSIAAIGLSLAAIEADPLGSVVAQPRRSSPARSSRTTSARSTTGACNSSLPRNPRTGPGTAANRGRP